MSKALRKILFVDDDHDIHYIVKICLQEIPHIEVRSAFSGEEAIKIAMDFVPDLILLDVMMPNMDGIATLQAFRLLSTFAKTPVIFLTAKAQKDEIQEYMKLGAAEVIPKPFNPAALGTKVQEIWDREQQMV